MVTAVSMRFAQQASNTRAASRPSARQAFGTAIPAPATTPPPATSDDCCCIPSLDTFFPGQPVPASTPTSPSTPTTPTAPENPEIRTLRQFYEHELRRMNQAISEAGMPVKDIMSVINTHTQASSNKPLHDQLIQIHENYGIAEGYVDKTAANLPRTLKEMAEKIHNGSWMRKNTSATQETLILGSIPPELKPEILNGFELGGYANELENADPAVQKQGVQKILDYFESESLFARAEREKDIKPTPGP